MPVPENPNNTIDDSMRSAIRDIGIPPRPTVLVQIDQEMQKDEPDFSRLAKILGTDVALAAALLKTANSPFFGFDKKVRSVQEALLVLGLKLVIQTVAGLSLKKAFEHVPHMERFWDASAATARVSGWLARQLTGRCAVRAEDAYTFGLFRDCGIPLLMIPFPEYRNVLKQANEEQVLSFTEVEDRAISINHATMGADLAESWLLPREIVLAIRYHHHLGPAGAVNRETAIEVLPAAAWTMIALAGVAEHLIQLKTGLDHTSEWNKGAKFDLQQLGLTEADLAELENDCGEVVTGRE